MSRTGYARVIVADGLLAPGGQLRIVRLQRLGQDNEPGPGQAWQKPPGRTLIGWMARSPTAP